MDELYGSETLLQIALVTGVLGGGAAFLAGRAIATPPLRVVQVEHASEAA